MSNFWFVPFHFNSNCLVSIDTDAFCLSEHANALFLRLCQAMWQCLPPDCRDFRRLYVNLNASLYRPFITLRKCSAWSNNTSERNYNCLIYGAIVIVHPAQATRSGGLLSEEGTTFTVAKNQTVLRCFYEARGPHDLRGGMGSSFQCKLFDLSTRVVEERAESVRLNKKPVLPLLPVEHKMQYKRLGREFGYFDVICDDSLMRETESIVFTYTGYADYSAATLFEFPRTENVCDSVVTTDKQHSTVGNKSTTTTTTTSVVTTTTTEYHDAANSLDFLDRVDRWVPMEMELDFSAEFWLSQFNFQSVMMAILAPP
jgi:hypothetical protein